MSEYFLTPTGHVERRIDTATRERELRAGYTVVTSGRLCTACLVGTWPMSMLRMNQTLCDTCRALDVQVAERAGLDDGTTAGRIVGRSARVIGLHGEADPVRGSIRQAADHREAVLAPVFVQARALGLVLLEESPHPGAAPTELVAVDDLREHDLITDTMEDRVGRFARWMAALDPAGHAARAHVLADVAPLARAMRATERAARRRNALSEVGEAVRDAAAAPRALLAAARRVAAAERLVP